MQKKSYSSTLLESINSKISKCCSERVFTVFQYMRGTMTTADIKLNRIMEILYYI